MNLTVIKRGKYHSFHTSFKKACQAYGWDYNRLIRDGGVPEKVVRNEGSKVERSYEVKKVKTEISIESQLLINYLESGFDQRNDWDEDWNNDEDLIMVYLEREGEIDYVVQVSIEIHNSGSNNPEEDDSYVKVLEIMSVIDHEGNVIPMDCYSDEILISKIKI